MPNPESAVPLITDPYDAVLLVSFGGPEKPEDVVPFLENVTRGRGIPRERLEAVGQHYFQFGGKSPINDQNKALIAAIESDFAAHDIDLPVYWGNRNWAPYLGDTVEQMARDGVRRALCLVTSAYSSWSSCRQYRENIAAAIEAVPEGLTPPQLDKARAYYNHPGFVAATVDGVLASLADLPQDVRDGALLVFVTHSIPVTMNDNSGPGGSGAYAAQHLEVAAVVAEQVREVTGVAHDHELVYCSRSGSPHTPWLEPDVNDRLEELAAGAEGTVPRAVVLIPVGFVSDHMEVVYDLDTEALATAAELGIPARRSASAGTHAAFVGALRDLVLERAAAERGEDVARAVVGTRGPVQDRCPVDCCLAAPVPAGRP
ncbi:MAG: ferrochelatase [Propionibacteriales bacterium]|nr:ferrochelatase [Propionibacteriales bacterium]